MNCGTQNTNSPGQRLALLRNDLQNQAIYYEYQKHKKVANILRARCQILSGDTQT